MSGKRERDRSPNRRNIRQAELIDLTEEKEESSSPSRALSESLQVQGEHAAIEEFELESRSQELAETLQAEEEASFMWEVELESYSQELAEELQAEEDSKALAVSLQMQENSETETEEEEEKKECAICFEEIEDDESNCPALTNSCSAVFHYNCINRWITDGRPNCPLCQCDSV